MSSIRIVFYWRREFYRHTSVRRIVKINQDQERKGRKAVKQVRKWL